MASRARPPGPACSVCSKPVKSGTLVVFRHGELFHVGCFSRQEQLRAIEQMDRARAAEAKAAEEIERAARLVKEAARLRRRELGPCAVCGQPFQPRAGYVRGSDGQPIHINCRPP